MCFLEPVLHQSVECWCSMNPPTVWTRTKSTRCAG
jgi:hypothetical protein